MIIYFLISPCQAGLDYFLCALPGAWAKLFSPGGAKKVLQKEHLLTLQFRATVLARSLALCSISEANEVFYLNRTTVFVLIFSLVNLCVKKPIIQMKDIFYKTPY